MTNASNFVLDNPTLFRRLSNALVFLGVLAFLIGAAIQHLYRFEGYLYVTLGLSEDVLVRETETGAPPGGLASWTAYETVSDLGSAPFNLGDAARAFYPAGRHDILKLPFRLRLDVLEVLEAPATRYAIVTRDPATGADKADDTRTPGRVAAGDVVTLAGQTWEVESIRPWMGLIHHVGGPPMANVSVQIGERFWEDIFLQDAAWLVGNGPTALRFEWFDSEEAALQAMRDSAPGPEAGRWGVQEGTGIHWIQSFMPGNGVTLNDGTEITLLDFESTFALSPDADYDAAADFADYEGPVMLVQIEREPVALRQLHTPRGLLHTEANAAATPEDVDNAPVLHMEYPAAYPNMVHVHAWRDGAAWVQVFHRQPDGSMQERRALLEESPDIQAATLTWDEGSALRLEQVLAQALPVDLQEEALQEAVLRSDTASGAQRLRLREGEWRHIGSKHVRLEPERHPGRVRQEFTAYTPGEQRSHGLLLGPGRTVQYQGWRIAQADAPVDTDAAALLSFSRRPSGPLWIKGCLLVAVGFLGRGYLWYRKRAPALSSPL